MKFFNQLKRKGKGRIQSGQKSQARARLLRLEHLENREMLSAAPIPLESVLSELSYVVVTGAKNAAASTAANAAEYTCEDLKTFLAAEQESEKGITYGATLSVVEEDIPKGVTVKYQWYRDGVAIDGANGINYDTTVFDVDCSMSVRATGYGDYEGEVSSVERVVQSPSSDTVITIDPEFNQLEQALKIVADGGMIQVNGSERLQTISLDSALHISKNITLNCGGNIISGEAGANASNKSVESSDVLETSASRTPVKYNRIVVDGGVSCILRDGIIEGFSGENGGAIESNGILTLVNITLKDNKATGYGGAVYCASGTSVKMINVLMQGNEAAINGGACYFSSDMVDISLTNVKIQENSAGKNGGGIFNGAGNTASIAGNVYIDNNYAGKNGGAFANYGTISIIASALEVSISGNRATRFGGAYFGCGSFTVEGTADVVFEENEVGYKTDDGSVDDYQGAKGGAIYNDVYGDLKGSVTLNANIIFSSNKATERGGAIQTYSELTIGGDVTFVENEALKYGGAVDVGKGGTASLSGVLVFESNKALGIDEVDGFGGAIFSASNTMIDDTHGGVYFASDSNCTFTDNYAESSGGAIDICAGLVHFGGSFTFAGNVANGPHGNDATGLGGAMAFAAYVEIEENTVFNWGVGNSAARGNCVAIDSSIEPRVKPEDFDLASEPGDDYSTFKVIRTSVSKENTLTPLAIAADAVSMNLTLGDRTTVIGTEGLTPEELGLSAGVYETFVEYMDVDGNTSPVYSFVLTVEQTATLNVVEKTIANGRGVQYFFDVVSESNVVPSSWLIDWGDGKTTRVEKLSSSATLAHYYQEDGNFDVSLTLVFNDGTKKELSGFATRTIGESAESEARAALFAEAAETEELFDTLKCGYGPFFQEL